MKQDKIFAVVKRAGGGSEIRLIERDQRTYNAVIEGKREVIPFPNLSGVCIIFDGEGVKNQKRPNNFLPEYNDLIVGTAIFAGIDFETGFVSLTAEQAVVIEDYLKANDAKGFSGNADECIASEYLPHTEENYLFGILSEVKTKYKALKIKWLKR
jgi:hypothetical protein